MEIVDTDKNTLIQKKPMLEPDSLNLDIQYALWGPLTHWQTFGWVFRASEL